MSVHSDDDLVSAIEQVYRRDYPRFLRVAVALLGDVDRGRDAVQETFARALRFRGGLRRIDSLDGWLLRMLVNVCRADRRPPTAPASEGDMAVADRFDDWQDVRAVIAALPERQRLVLFLRHYADLDYRQIGEVAGIDRGTVAATLHTAHQKIRKAISEVPQ